MVISSSNHITVKVSHKKIYSIFSQSSFAIEVLKGEKTPIGESGGLCHVATTNSLYLGF